jgi:hypothetical protein
MPLSNKDLSDIAQEFATAKGEMADDKAAIPAVQEQVDKKQDQADRMYILYNDSHVERVTPYETEHRWLNGTTYTTITQSQIETFSPDTGKNTYFYPISWTKANAQLQANGNGNPKTTSGNSESAQLNNSIEDGGIIAQIGLLRNGQSSGAPSRTLDLAYSPGASTLTFTTSHSFTNGRYLYVSGSGTSALVKITGTTSLTVNIQEIIAPAGTIAIGGTAVENIAGFSNSERQTLTSGTYQRILTQLTTNISSAAALYNTALANQLTQLNINIDQPAQITAAKNSVTAAQTAYSTWNGLPNTGVGGKWTDTPLDDFATSYNSRNSGISSRISQITTALGSVSQNAEGQYSGNGQYLQRYKCMNFLINTANGPLQQINGLKGAKGNFEQRVANTADKLATFSNLVRYGGFTKDPTGNSVEVDGASQFAPSDSVLLSGTDLPSIECTVSSVSGKIVVLSITIPPAYNKAAKGGIIKKV